MERVETLLEKLQTQFADKASIEELLLTVQLLQAELSHLQSMNPAPSQRGVSIDIPVSFNTMSNTQTATPVKPDEKIVEVLQVDDAEVEAELEEIRRNAEAMQKMSLHNKQPIIFEEEEVLPAVPPEVKKKAESREVNEMIEHSGGSLNDTLKQTKLELSDTLMANPIRDLKKAIGVNDRFLYINELFRGDEPMYERSIKTINSFSILAEAEYWIQRELKVKLGWNDKNETVKQFIQLVKRRFS